MVTTFKKNNVKLTKREQNERDLFWVSSLLQLLPPVGDEDKWKQMTPAACKIYLLIWALDYAQWTLEEGAHYYGVHIDGLHKYSGLDGKTVNNTIGELVGLDLIKLMYEKPGYTYCCLLFNLPPDVIENGV